MLINNIIFAIVLFFLVYMHSVCTNWIWQQKPTFFIIISSTNLICFEMNIYDLNIIVDHNMNKSSGATLKSTKKWTLKLVCLTRNRFNNQINYRHTETSIRALIRFNSIRLVTLFEMKYKSQHEGTNRTKRTINYPMDFEVDICAIDRAV